MNTEQSALRASLIITLAVAALGIAFGLVSGSHSITFDGIFSLVDAAMTVLSMVVASLILRSTQRDGLSQGLRNRFSLGFWHFEPMVLAFNALIMMAIMVYALFNAVISLREGGREIAFGAAIGYAALVVLVCFGFGYLEHRANRQIRSAFVAMDVKGWLMTGGVSLALLLAFGLGFILQRTDYAHFTPYIDPLVLVLVCLVLLPVPVSTLRQALAEIALVTPADLKLRVDKVAAQIVKEEGFIGYQAYLARAGRGDQIEIYFIVPTGMPARTVEHWDAVRDRIGEQLDEANPHHWITVAFTTKPERAG